jgi:hypothetical protein
MGIFSALLTRSEKHFWNYRLGLENGTTAEFFCF